jgi:hypothetical protein
MADDTGGAGTVNLTALGVGAGGLFTLVSGLAVTGSMGRVLRNAPTQITWAVVLVLLGAALLGAAGLPATGKPTEVVFSIVGLEVTLAGLVIAALAAATSGHDVERPAIHAKLDESTHRLTGSVVAADLASDARLVAIVEGVGKKATPLERTEIGPDGDGKVDLDIDVRVPPGRFDSVRVRARSVASDGSRLASGSVTLPLAPMAPSPSVQAHWAGTNADASRLAIQVTAADRAGRPVAVVVKRRLRTGRYLRFYRGVLMPDGDGSLDTQLEVPVVAGAHRVCVGAAFVHNGFPRFACRGRASELTHGDRAVIEMRQPKADG